MTYDGTRLTLITSAPHSPVEWKAAGARTRLAFVGSITALRIALEFAVGEIGLDVERVIVDRVGETGDFKILLSRIPKEFAGDVLCLRHDGSGWISVTGGGRDRFLQSLSAGDVRSYLAGNDLVADVEQRIA